MRKVQKIFYKSIEEDSEFEIEKIKGSRFIALVSQVENKEDIEEKLVEIKKKYPSARHYCYAYVLGYSEARKTKFSDDGEPSGTAGKPILSVLSGSRATNMLLTVVRYFGGIKLGTGGLIKAYSEAAKAIIKHSSIIEVEIYDKLSFDYDYNHTNLVMRLLNNYEASIIDPSYDNSVRVRIQINQGFAERFCAEIWDKSQGQISCG